jgi:hypothetical protein
MAAVSPTYDRWAYALPMTCRSHCPLRLLRPRVTNAQEASSYRFRPVRTPPSLLPYTLLSVTFVPGHLRPYRLPEVRGLCSSAVVRSASLPSSFAPSFVASNGGFSFLLSFLRRFLWDRLLLTYLFWDSVFRSYVLNRFWIAPFPRSAYIGVPTFPFASPLVSFFIYACFF